jgi:hypothetical protein
MTLQTISDWIMSKLTDEAGSNEWWSETQIKAIVGDIYRDTALSLLCLNVRDDSTVTEVGLARYPIVCPTGIASCLKLQKVAYDETVNGPLDFYTIEQLDSIDYRWRGLGDGLPWGAYFENGDVNTHVSLVCPPNDTLALAFYFIGLPTQLDVSDEPFGIFKDGIFLKNATMSAALSLSGGGRDPERSDWYFSQAISVLPALSGHKSPVWRGFRSIDDAGIRRGPRLPANYPSYSD